MLTIFLTNLSEPSQKFGDKFWPKVSEPSQTRGNIGTTQNAICFARRNGKKGTTIQQLSVRISCDLFVIKLITIHRNFEERKKFPPNFLEILYFKIENKFFQIFQIKFSFGKNFFGELQNLVTIFFNQKYFWALPEIW